MTKALLGSSKQAVRSVNRILQRRNNPAFLAERRRSRAHYGLGEGHGRGEDLGVAALKDRPAQGDRNVCTAEHARGEIRLRTGVRWPQACLPAVPGQEARPISAAHETAKRAAEVSAGSSSDEGHGQHNLSLIHISEPTRRTPISYAV